MTFLKIFRNFAPHFRDKDDEWQTSKCKNQKPTPKNHKENSGQNMMNKLLLVCAQVYGMQSRRRNSAITLPIASLSSATQNRLTIILATVSALLLLAPVRGSASAAFTGVSGGISTESFLSFDPTICRCEKAADVFPPPATPTSAVLDCQPCSHDFGSGTVVTAPTHADATFSSSGTQSLTFTSNANGGGAIPFDAGQSDSKTTVQINFTVSQPTPVNIIVSIGLSGPNGSEAVATLIKDSTTTLGTMFGDQNGGGTGSI